MLTLIATLCFMEHHLIIMIKVDQKLKIVQNQLNCSSCWLEF